VPLLPAGFELPVFAPERFDALLEQEDVRTLVAERDGELVGLTTFGTSRDPGAPAAVAEVRSFYVAPSTWRRGVGAELMSRSFAGLQEMGFAVVTLWSFATNERANAFYEAQGFTRDGAQRREEVWANLLEVRYRRALP
jgi:GNAT superfamily N-acetyltransferase